MNRWLQRSDVQRGDAYDERWRTMAASGANIHGEADRVQRLLEAEPPPEPARPWRVLDAGCGTGRVAVELARRGFEVTGVDLDPAMLDEARRKLPSGRWLLADLATLALADHPPVDLVAAPGNVMIFLAPGTEAVVLQRLAAHLRPGGLLVAGFQLGGDRLDLPTYDRLAGDAGLALVERSATWDGEPYQGGDYAVSIHRLAAG